MSPDEISEMAFLCERARVIDDESAVDGDGRLLRIARLIEARIEGNYGFVAVEGSSRFFHLANPVDRALFRHQVDELIIRARIAAPSSLNFVGFPGRDAVLPADTFQGRLANHLWRSDNADLGRLPFSSQGRGAWRSIRSMSTLQAAAIAVKLMTLPDPVLSASDLDKTTGRLRAIARNLWEALERKQIYCFVQDDSSCRVLAKMVEGDVVRFWVAENDDDDLIDVLGTLELFAEHYPELT